MPVFSLLSTFIGVFIPLPRFCSQIFLHHFVFIKLGYRFLRPAEWLLVCFQTLAEFKNSLKCILKTSQWSNKERFSLTICWDISTFYSSAPRRTWLRSFSWGFPGMLCGQSLDSRSRKNPWSVLFWTFALNFIRSNLGLCVRLLNHLFVLTCLFDNYCYSNVSFTTSGEPSSSEGLETFWNFMNQ